MSTAARSYIASLCTAPRSVKLLSEPLVSSGRQLDRHRRPSAVGNPCERSLEKYSDRRYTSYRSVFKHVPYIRHAFHHFHHFQPKHGIALIINHSLSSAKWLQRHQTWSSCTWPRSFGPPADQAQHQRHSPRPPLDKRPESIAATLARGLPSSRSMLTVPLLPSPLHHFNVVSYRKNMVDVIYNIYIYT